jgi:hypothetical protein
LSGAQRQVPPSDIELLAPFSLRGLRWSERDVNLLLLWLRSGTRLLLFALRRNGEPFSLRRHSAEEEIEAGEQSTRAGRRCQNPHPLNRRKFRRTRNLSVDP